MHADLRHYMTGDHEDFQDFLEDPLCTASDQIDALNEIGEKGWDECLEILVSREAKVLEIPHAAQAWLNMASNGHADCWLQMLPFFYQGHAQAPELWSEALAVGKADSQLEKFWDVYALTTALEGMVKNEVRPDVAQMAMLSMRIELLHGLDAETADEGIALAFANKHIVDAGKSRTVDNVFDDMSWN